MVTAMDTIKRRPVRKPSVRDMSAELAIHSSDGTPSDHSSLYDATVSGQGTHHLPGITTSSEAEDSGACRPTSESHSTATHQVRFVNKTNGTPLFTIAEQKSLNTLRTVPSNWTFQRRIVTYDPASNTAISMASNVAGKDVPQRRCKSLDETAAQRTGLLDGSSRGLSSDNSTSQITASRLAERCKPAKPPFSPPQRVRTPEGVPRWPGERDYSPPAQRASTRTALLKYLRQRGNGGLRFKDVLRANGRNAEARPAVTGRRYWRPPISGHGTLRYDGLDNHPFAAQNCEDELQAFNELPQMRP